MIRVLSLAWIPLPLPVRILLLIGIAVCLFKLLRWLYEGLPEEILRSLVKFWDRLFLCLTWIFTGATILALGFILFHILSNGIRHLVAPGLFAVQVTLGDISMFPAIVSTVLMVVIVLAISVPLGMFTAVYLVEYVKTGSRFVTIIRSAAEILAGIPSIVYGLFGMMFFRVFLGFGYSILAGSLTMSIMMLPLIMRTTEEALKSVPDSFREGSFALGAGKLRTVFRIILPSAMPGILAGVILSIGRVVGESAALIFTAGTILQIPSSLFDSASTLTVHMWRLSNYGRYVNETYATAVVLLMIVLLLNGISGLIARKFSKS